MDTHTTATVGRSETDAYELFFVMTLQWVTSSETIIATNSGGVTPPPGSTARQAYMAARSFALERNGLTEADEPVVLFYHVEPMRTEATK